MNGITKEEVAEYIALRWGTRAEYIFKNSPNTGIFRHHENKKWYGALMRVLLSKFGSKKGGSVNILNCKCDPVLLAGLIDGKSIFPAYHINKTHWLSLFLDGSLDPETVFPIIELSYQMTLPMRHIN